MQTQKSQKFQPTHEELHAQALDAAKKEKSATLDLLRFLKQIEERRTFTILGYPSLFKYVEDALGYSPAQTSERISAMRLLRQVPEVAEKLTDGAHTLTSIAKLASHVRRENLQPEQASALVLETANQTIMNLEKHLAGAALVEPPKVERTKVISKELTRLTLDVDDEFMALVQRMRELKGNPALHLSEAFRCAMQEFVRKRDVRVQDAKVQTIKNQQEESGASVTEVKSVSNVSQGQQFISKAYYSQSTQSPLQEQAARNVPRDQVVRTRYIRAQDRRTVRIRARDECEFVHEKSGKRCGSKTGLQFEHITPFAKGGTNTEQNLKLYCPAHNRLSAIRAYGETKMRQYMRC